MSPALSQLVEGYYRRRRRALITLGAIAGSALALVLGWAAVSVVHLAEARCPAQMRRRAACLDRHHRDVATRTAVLGAVPAILVLLAAAGGFPLRDPARAPLLRILAAPERIAWIHPKRTSVRRRGVEVSHALEVVVCTVDGARVALSMSDDDVSTAVRLASTEAPWAARGYSPELEAQFRASPASLRRAGPG